VKALRKDPAHDQEEALKDIYRRLRPGDPPTVANARALLKRLFFDPKKYDLGRVGRYKINQKLGIDVDLTERILTDKDFIAAIKYLINLRRGEGTLDDIDHLGSRRARTRRIESRSRRIRSARRPSVALRPDLSDRNSGRSEHRLDQFDVDLRTDQRIWFH